MSLLNKVNSIRSLEYDTTVKHGLGYGGEDCLAGIFSSFTHSWLACGPQLFIINNSDGSLLCSWTFGEQSPEQFDITCAVELQMEGCSIPLLVLGISSENTNQICFFNPNTRKIIRAIDISYPVRILCIIEDGLNEVNPINNALTKTQGLFAGGCADGSLLLFDLCRGVLLKALNADFGFISDEENPVEVGVIDVSAVSTSTVQQKLKECYIKQNNFAVLLKGPSDEGVTALHYSLESAILFVGTSSGSFILLNMSNMECIFRSQHTGRAVTSISLLEPCDDPRHNLFLWICYEDFPQAVMYCTSFSSKYFVPGYGVYYQGFESAGLVYRLILGVDENLVAKRAINSQAVSKNILRSSNLFDGDSYQIRLFITSYEVYNKGQIANRAVVFDLNQWYKEQMPDEGASLCLDTVALSGNTLWHLALDPASVSHYQWVRPLEQHFHPSSLDFRIWCIEEEGINCFEKLGLQSQWLRNMSVVGPSALLTPTQLFHGALSAGLLPMFDEPPDPDNVTVEEERMYILTVCLENRAISVIEVCAREWSSGGHPVAGCTLAFLTSWLWSLHGSYKNHGNRMCVPLFDQSGLGFDVSERRALQHCKSLLCTVESLYTNIVKKYSTYVFVDGMEQKLTAMSLVRFYFDSCLKLISAKLLPEPNDAGLPRGSIMYKYDEINEFVNSKRKEGPFLGDSLLGKTGGEMEWEEEGGAGRYPPPSIQSALRYCLHPAPSLANKLSLLLYLYMDILHSNKPLRDQSNFEDVKNFQYLLRIPDVQYKIVTSFWFLDHSLFDEGISLLLDPRVLPVDLNDDQHRSILSLLVLQHQEKLGLQYLRLKAPALHQPNDIRLELELLLANRLINEAFMFQRKHPELRESLLIQFFKGCIAKKLLGPVFGLHLDSKEEAVLLKFLKSSDLKEKGDLQVLLLLSRAKYTEAISLNERLNSTSNGPRTRMETDTRDMIVRGVTGGLNTISRKLAYEMKQYRPPPPGTCPKPLSALIKIRNEPDGPLCQADSNALLSAAASSIRHLSDFVNSDGGKRKRISPAYEELMEIDADDPPRKRVARCYGENGIVKPIASSFGHSFTPPKSAASRQEREVMELVGTPLVKKRGKRFSPLSKPSSILKGKTPEKGLTLDDQEDTPRKMLRFALPENEKRLVGRKPIHMKSSSLSDQADKLLEESKVKKLREELRSAGNSSLLRDGGIDWRDIAESSKPRVLFSQGISKTPTSQSSHMFLDITVSSAEKKYLESPTRESEASPVTEAVFNTTIPKRLFSTEEHVRDFQNELEGINERYLKKESVLDKYKRLRKSQMNDVNIEVNLGKKPLEQSMTRQKFSFQKKIHFEESQDREEKHVAFEEEREVVCENKEEDICTNTPSSNGETSVRIDPVEEHSESKNISRVEEDEKIQNNKGQESLPVITSVHSLEEAFSPDHSPLNATNVSDEVEEEEAESSNHEATVLIESVLSLDNTSLNISNESDEVTSSSNVQETEETKEDLEEDAKPEEGNYSTTEYESDSLPEESDEDSEDNEEEDEDESEGVNRQKYESKLIRKAKTTAQEGVICLDSDSNDGKDESEEENKDSNTKKRMPWAGSPSDNDISLDYGEEENDDEISDSEIFGIPKNNAKPSSKPDRKNEEESESKDLQDVYNFTDEEVENKEADSDERSIDKDDSFISNNEEVIAKENKSPNHDSEEQDESNEEDGGPVQGSNNDDEPVSLIDSCDEEEVTNDSNESENGISDEEDDDDNDHEEYDEDEYDVEDFVQNTVLIRGDSNDSIGSSFVPVKVASKYEQKCEKEKSSDENKDPLSGISEEVSSTSENLASGSGTSSGFSRNYQESGLANSSHEDRITSTPKIQMPARNLDGTQVEDSVFQVPEETLKQFNKIKDPPKVAANASVVSNVNKESNEDLNITNKSQTELDSQTIKDSVFQIPEETLRQFRKINYVRKEATNVSVVSTVKESKEGLNVTTNQIQTELDSHTNKDLPEESTNLSDIPTINKENNADLNNAKESHVEIDSKQNVCSRSTGSFIESNEVSEENCQVELIQKEVIGENEISQVQNKQTDEKLIDETCSVMSSSKLPTIQVELSSSESLSNASEGISEMLSTLKTSEIRHVIGVTESFEDVGLYGSIDKLGHISHEDIEDPLRDKSKDKISDEVLEEPGNDPQIIKGSQETLKNPIEISSSENINEEHLSISSGAVNSQSKCVNLNEVSEAPSIEKYEETDLMKKSSHSQEDVLEKRDISEAPFAKSEEATDIGSYCETSETPFTKTEVAICGETNNESENVACDVITSSETSYHKVDKTSEACELLPKPMETTVTESVVSSELSSEKTIEAEVKSEKSSLRQRETCEGTDSLKVADICSGVNDSQQTSVADSGLQNLNKSSFNEKSLPAQTVEVDSPCFEVSNGQACITSGKQLVETGGDAFNVSVTSSSDDAETVIDEPNKLSGKNEPSELSSDVTCETHVRIVDDICPRSDYNEESPRVGGTLLQQNVAETMYSHKNNTVKSTEIVPNSPLPLEISNETLFDNREPQTSIDNKHFDAVSGSQKPTSTNENDTFIQSGSQGSLEDNSKVQVTVGGEIDNSCPNTIGSKSSLQMSTKECAGTVQIVASSQSRSEQTLMDELPTKSHDITSDNSLKVIETVILEKKLQKFSEVANISNLKVICDSTKVDTSSAEVVESTSCLMEQASSINNTITSNKNVLPIEENAYPEADIVVCDNLSSAEPVVCISSSTSRTLTTSVIPVSCTEIDNACSIRGTEHTVETNETLKKMDPASNERVIIEDNVDTKMGDGTGSQTSNISSNQSTKETEASGRDKITTSAEGRGIVVSTSEFISVAEVNSCSVHLEANVATAQPPSSEEQSNINIPDSTHHIGSDELQNNATEDHNKQLELPGSSTTSETIISDPSPQQSKELPNINEASSKEQQIFSYETTSEEIPRGNKENNKEIMDVENEGTKTDNSKKVVSDKTFFFGNNDSETFLRASKATFQVGSRASLPSEDEPVDPMEIAMIEEGDELEEDEDTDPRNTCMLDPDFSLHLSEDETIKNTPKKVDKSMVTTDSYLSKKARRSSRLKEQGASKVKTSLLTDSPLRKEVQRGKSKSDDSQDISKEKVNLDKAKIISDKRSFSTQTSDSFCEIKVSSEGTVVLDPKPPESHTSVGSQKGSGAKQTSTSQPILEIKKTKNDLDVEDESSSKAKSSRVSTRHSEIKGILKVKGRMSSQTTECARDLTVQGLESSNDNASVKSDAEAIMRSRALKSQYKANVEDREVRTDPYEIVDNVQKNVSEKRQRRSSVNSLNSDDAKDLRMRQGDFPEEIRRSRRLSKEPEIQGILKKTGESKNRRSSHIDKEERKSSRHSQLLSQEVSSKEKKEVQDAHKTSKDTFTRLHEVEEKMSSRNSMEPELHGILKKKDSKSSRRSYSSETTCELRKRLKEDFPEHNKRSRRYSEEPELHSILKRSETLHKKSRKSVHSVEVAQQLDSGFKELIEEKKKSHNFDNDYQDEMTREGTSRKQSSSSHTSETATDLRIRLNKDFPEDKSRSRRRSEEPEIRGILKNKEDNSRRRRSSQASENPSDLRISPSEEFSRERRTSRRRSVDLELTDAIEKKTISERRSRRLSQSSETSDIRTSYDDLSENKNRSRKSLLLSRYKEDEDKKIEKSSVCSEQATDLRLRIEEDFPEDVGRKPRKTSLSSDGSSDKPVASKRQRHSLSADLHREPRTKYTRSSLGSYPEVAGSLHSDTSEDSSKQGRARRGRNSSDNTDKRPMRSSSNEPDDLSPTGEKKQKNSSVKESDILKNIPTLPAEQSPVYRKKSRSLQDFPIRRSTRLLHPILEDIREEDEETPRKKRRSLDDIDAAAYKKSKSGSKKKNEPKVFPKLVIVESDSDEEAPPAMESVWSIEGYAKERRLTRNQKKVFMRNQLLAEDTPSPSTSSSPAKKQSRKKTPVPESPPRTPTRSSLRLQRMPPGASD